MYMYSESAKNAYMMSRMSISICQQYRKPPIASQERLGSEADGAYAYCVWAPSQNSGAVVPWAHG